MSVAFLPFVAGQFRGCPVRAVLLPSQSDPLFVLADLYAAVWPDLAGIMRDRVLATVTTPELRLELPDGLHVVVATVTVRAWLKQMLTHDHARPTDRRELESLMASAASRAA